MRSRKGRPGRSEAQEASANERISGLAYGVRLTGELPPAFRPYLLPLSVACPPGELAVELVYRDVESLPGVEEIWVSEAELSRSEGRFALFLDSGGFGLSVLAEGQGMFRCRPDRIEIDWLAGASAAPHYLFAHALPLWLESQGRPVLHASAVAFGDRAVAFLGPSGIGKSTLCAELVKLGCRLVADDGLAVRESGSDAWLCALGPPMLRLWPSALEGRMGVTALTLPRVYARLEKRLWAPPMAGELPAEMPLAAIFLLRRAAEDDALGHIEESSAREGLVELLAHGVAGAAAAALGLAASRFERLARLASELPVRRLTITPARDAAARIRAVIERRI